MQNQSDRTLSCRWANSPSAMDQVFKLRYQCYFSKGAIPPSEDARFSDPFDQDPNQFSFLVESDPQTALATVRITVVRPDLGWTTSPSSKVFGDHAAFQDIARNSFVEASRLCFGAHARRDVLYRLLANMVAMADFHKADWLVACPRVEHSDIYQRLFGFRQLAAPRKYFGVNFETDLLGIPLEEIRNVANKHKSMSQAWNDAWNLVTSVFDRPQVIQ